MKTNNKTNPKLKLASILLVSGAGLATIGCNNVDKLFFTVNGKDLEVTFCDRGASIYSIKYNDTYITYHPKDKNTFLRNDYYYGKALGRVAGRIKDGKLSVGGKDYQLDVNETDNYYKKNNIHGGSDAISTKNFTHTIKETDEANIVTFTYLSPALESKFPEELYCVYTYKVYKNESKMDISITGTPSGETPVNLSNHPYFRLSNTGNVLNHTLKMNNSKYLAKFEMHTDKRTDQTVTGTIDLDNASYWDFRGDNKKIGDNIEAAKQEDLTSGGYDHIWKFEGGSCDVELKNPDNGISLKVTSDADAVIMYANCYPHESDEMNPSGKDALYAGITIEPIKFFTRDHLEVLNCTPDKPFQRTITYTLSK